MNLDICGKFYADQDVGFKRVTGDKWDIIIPQEVLSEICPKI